MTAKHQRSRRSWITFLAIVLSVVVVLSAMLTLGQGLAQAGAATSASAHVPGSWRVAPGYWYDSSPAVARGDGCYLLVYSSERNGSNIDIYGLCTGSDGSPAGSPIRISTGPGSEWAPAVACSASGQFLVAWCDNYYAGQADIYGQRVDSFGNLVGGELPICLGPAYEDAPRIAYNSSSNEYLVVWQDSRAAPQGRIYGRRVAHDGTIPTSEFVIATGSATMSYPAVAYSNTLHRYMVVWQDDRSGNSDVYGQLLFEDGTPDGGEKTICVAAGSQGCPEVCLNGSNYEWLVVWQDGRDTSTYSYDVRGRRLTSAGNPTGSELVITAGTGTEAMPAVVYDANNQRFLVAWHDYTVSPAGVIQARWVNGDGSFPGASFTVASGSAYCYEPALCYYHSGSISTVLAVWSDQRGRDGTETFAQRINDDSSLDGEAFGISKWAEQTYPAVVYNVNNDEYLLVWSDQRSGKDQVWGRRLDGAGNPISGDFLIATGTYDQSSPDVAYSSYAGRYLVVWTSGNVTVGYDVWAQLIGADGSLIGSNFPICTWSGWQSDPAVASSDSSKGFLVVWVYSHTSETDIWGRIVNNDGSFGSYELPICGAAGYQAAPAIAYSSFTGTDSDAYMVVWYDQRNGVDNFDIYGRRVFRTGDLGSEFAVVTDPNNQEYPSIAYNPSDDQFLVVWDERNGTSLDIYGRLMSAAGSVVSSVHPICTEGHEQLGPAVTYSPPAVSYLVVWQDKRSGQWDIYGARLWRYLDFGVAEFPICTAPGHQGGPDPAYNSIQKNFLVAWSDPRVSWRQDDIYAGRITERAMPYDIFLPAILRGYYGYTSLLSPESLASGASAAGLAAVVAFGLLIVARKGTDRDRD